MTSSSAIVPPSTPRLALRRFRADDVDEVYRLDRDPRVMRYIGDGSVRTREEVALSLARARAYYRNYPGLGVWAADERASRRFIGWFCLKYMPNTADVEVGYRLLPEAWGKGYATEGASALVRYGFETLGLYLIIGVTHPGNAASQRVLRKAGLHAAGTTRYWEREVRLFAVENPDGGARMGAQG